VFHAVGSKKTVGVFLRAEKYFQAEKSEKERCAWNNQVTKELNGGRMGGHEFNDTPAPTAGLNS
jgi:hypothetical protein